MRKGREKVFCIRGKYIPESCLNIALAQTPYKDIPELTIEIGGRTGFIVADPFFEEKHFLTGMELTYQQVLDVMVSLIKNSRSIKNDIRFPYLRNANLLY